MPLHGAFFAEIQTHTLGIAEECEVFVREGICFRVLLHRNQSSPTRVPVLMRWAATSTNAAIMGNLVEESLLRRWLFPLLSVMLVKAKVVIVPGRASGKNAVTQPSDAKTSKGDWRERVHHAYRSMVPRAW